MLALFTRNIKDTAQMKYLCAKYEEHVDHFTDRDVKSAEALGPSGNRLVSLFVYLNDCESGGCTNFPARFCP